MADMPDDTWRDGYVHYAVECYQSSPDAGMACGIRLSTWATPERMASWPKQKTSPNSETDLGYTWAKKRVTCPKCRSEIEKNKYRGP